MIIPSSYLHRNRVSKALKLGLAGEVLVVPLQIRNFLLVRSLVVLANHVCDDLPREARGEQLHDVSQDAEKADLQPGQQALSMTVDRLDTTTQE